MRKWLSLASLGALLSVSFCAFQNPPADSVGIIILHGKLGTPTERKAGLANVARYLEAAGYLTAVPAMPWDEARWEHIAIDIPGAFALIDDIAAGLRNRGAQRIVLVGHSQGANVALSYAVARGSVAGLVMAAPGHRPDALARQDPMTLAAVQAARTLVEAGKGTQEFVGPDGIQSASITLRTTANIYFSWMDPTGLASMETQAVKLSPTIPLLMVISRRDPFFSEAYSRVYQPASKHPYSKYLPVGGDHSTTPSVASNLIRNWIEGLPR